MPQFWPPKPKGKCAGWLLGKMLFLPVKGELYNPILAVCPPASCLWAWLCEDTMTRATTAL